MGSLTMESVRVGVVGAGVVGLTSALKLQQQIEGVQVTLLSEKFSPDLTSNVAAGIFLWSLSAPDTATGREWAESSWSWFQCRKQGHGGLESPSWLPMCSPPVGRVRWREG